MVIQYLGYRAIFPRGVGSASGPLPPGYVMVSRWVGPGEVKHWMANGGTFIPPSIGRTSGWVSVVLAEDRGLPAGIGRDSVIRIDFAVPGAALQSAGVGKRLQQSMTHVPIYNVSIHIPMQMDVNAVLRHGGA